MKQHLAGIVLLLSLSTFSWGQGSNEVFDVQRSKMELEIMRGILRTTLNFRDRNSQNQYSRWRFSDLNAFYLAGQGAVFMISTPGYSVTRRFYASSAAIPEQITSLNRELSALSRELSADAARITREGAALSSGASGTKTGQAVNPSVVPPPPTPAPPSPPSPAAPPAVSVNPDNSGEAARRATELENLRRRVDEYQARAKQSQAELEASRQEFLQILGEVKLQLVEALANYGDSLTTVKPDEYINLVLITDDFDSQGSQSDVISTKKAWITDYKAGRLTLEGFRQKVVQYTE